MSSVHMRDLFIDDPQRHDSFSIRLDDLLLDYSRNRISSETMRLLLDLAREQQLPQWIEDQFTGKKINFTEHRAVLHTALRSNGSQKLILDGQDVNAVVREVLEKMLYLAVGDEHQERYYFDQLVEFLRKKSPGGFLWGSAVFDEQDDHNSMRVTGALEGIRWVFRDWKLHSPRVFGMTYQQIEAHYVEATHRFKQPLTMNPDEITAAVYWGLHDPTRVARSTELSLSALARWPNLHSTHAAYSTCNRKSCNRRVNRHEGFCIHLECPNEFDA